MSSKIFNRAGYCALCALVWGAFAAPTMAVNPSLCLSEPTGCDEPGSTVNVEVLVGPGDPTIVGVQFKLSYDPQSLTALEILPGSGCDAASPFSLEIHQSIDEAQGTLFYAVGTNPFKGGSGTNQAATVACIRFLPRGVSTSDICISVGQHPDSTRLSDNFGHLVIPDNSAACPSGSAMQLACKDAIVEDVCRCESDADCVTLNGQCCVGTCDTASSLCRVTPINEGGVCDDNNDCTSNDRCSAGMCRGSDCENQSLCLGVACAPPGSWLTVPVLLGEGDPLITGGQFTVQWDPAGLQFVAAEPGSSCYGSSPFVNEIASIENPLAGELFYAAGVDLSGAGTQGPATLACLYFYVLDGSLADICLFEDINPFLTKLVDDRGQFVDFYSEGSCSSDRGFPFIDCEHGSVCEIPTTSEWGLVLIALGLLIGAKITFRSRTEARAY